MTRALANFSVRHGALRLRVRVLPTVRTVDAEYRAGRRRRGGKWVHAFFLPTFSPSASYDGTIVLPADGRLVELVPHEVVHAVMHHLGGVHCTGDEPLATAVGLLSARIFSRLERLGYGGAKK